ncbi:MAG TPA: hypothetical protein PLS49_03645 [Candidatus Woesebacteria bacterium]|nr:hypothetical protein [Candidatus Woesebacteria bacterium]
MGIYFSQNDIRTIHNPELVEKIQKLLNFVEELVTINKQLSQENQRLKKELNRLKKQSASPTFSAKSYLSKKIKTDSIVKKWQKTKRKTIEIDQEKEILTITQCECGCEEFSTLRTDTKIMQGITIKRNNTSYILKEKKCKNCGKIYKPTIPKDIKGIEFDTELRT